MLQVLAAIFAVITGLYPIFYFILDRKFSLLAYKDDLVLANEVWNIAFYIHIIAGGLSLVTGWLQFLGNIRKRQPDFHRNTGKLYIIFAMLAALAGFYLSAYATGGYISSLGFGLLAIFWFYTTLTAFIHARHNRIGQHRQMALYSYAACFAAVTLRLWLQLLVLSGMDFIPAYRIVAWLSWLPNIIVAAILIKKNTIVTHP